MTVGRYAAEPIDIGILVERIQLDPNSFTCVVSEPAPGREARIEGIAQLSGQGILEGQIRKQRHTAFAADVESRRRPKSARCRHAESDTQNGSRHDSSFHFVLLVLLAVVFP